MDDLDSRILREFCRDQVLLFGGTDPRVSAGDISQRLGVDRSVIHRRIRAWEDAGFLRRFTTLPSARLFGVGVAACGIRVPDAGSKGHVLESVALVDGIVHSLEHVGEWVGVGFVDDGAAAVTRRTSLIARIPGVAEVEPPHSWVPPEPTMSPTPLGWRVIAALRGAAPRATLAEMAADVGISVNTFHKHYDKLVRAGAIWSAPDLDFTRWEGSVFARLILALEPGVAPGPVAAEAMKRVPEAWPSTNPRGRDGAPAPVAVLNLQLPSVGRVEDAVVALQGLGGVLEIETYYPKTNRIIDAWFNERVATKVAAAE